MPFSLCAAADVYGSKINLQLDFEAFPTIAEIVAAVQTTFSYECSVLRPSSVPLQVFGVSKLQVFRDEDGQWHDLLSPAQLREFCQLYVIQSDPSYSESQQQILPARKPTRPMTLNVSAPRTALPASPPRASTTVYATAPLVASSYRTAPAVVDLPSVSPPPRTQSPARTPAADRYIATAAAPVGSSSPASYFPSARITEGGAQVPQSEKIRLVFDEMDVRGARSIQPDGFRDVLRALNIDFSTATVNDLFKKADVDRDGQLSMAEFAQFFSAYTTLLDSLYYRLRDIADGRLLQQSVASERTALDAAIDRRNRALAAVSDSSRQADQQAHAVKAIEGDRALKAAREQELRGLASQGDDDLRLANAQRQSSANDFDLHRDRETQSQAQLQAALRDAQDTERRVMGEQQLLAAAQEKERQLHALLLEAQRETERQQKNLYQAQVDSAQARDREAHSQTVLAEAQRDLQRAHDRLSVTEREVLLKTERQKELSKVLSDAQLELARVGQRVDDERRELAACEERARLNRTVAQDADGAVVAQEQRLSDKEREVVHFSQRRAAMEVQEKPLLEQEVRLREQRDNLEEKEIRLRREAGSFFDGSRQLGTGGGGASAGFRSLSPQRR